MVGQIPTLSEVSAMTTNAVREQPILKPASMYDFVRLHVADFTRDATI
jgi:hypothetical protein